MLNTKKTMDNTITILPISHDSNEFKSVLIPLVELETERFPSIDGEEEISDDAETFIGANDKSSSMVIGVNSVK